MQYVEGSIYQESGFIKGHLGFENGTVTELGRGPCPGGLEPVAKGVVLPLFTNCHTHIGDAIARGRKLEGDIESLVAPPDGLKFRILRESAPDDLVKAMNKAITEMLDTGTGTFSDFREGGSHGVELLRQATASLPINTIVMGRPKEHIFSTPELSGLLPKVDGLGLSSITDWEYSELQKVAKEAKRKGKRFALHASERMREDIDLILDLKPDFVVHMTYGTADDFESLAENGIPVVLCPRSNLFFDHIPNISLMLEKGLTLVLGTDNAMINSCNLFEELRAGFEIATRSNRLTVKAEDILKMATVNTKGLLGPQYYTDLAPGMPSRFMVLESPMSDKPEYALVQEVTADKIKIIMIGETEWKM